MMNRNELHELMERLEALEALAGVSAVEVDLESGEARIEGQIQDQAIRAALDEEGYAAKAIVHI